MIYNSTTWSSVALFCQPKLSFYDSYPIAICGYDSLVDTVFTTKWLNQIFYQSLPLFPPTASAINPCSTIPRVHTIHNHNFHYLQVPCTLSTIFLFRQIRLFPISLFQCFHQTLQCHQPLQALLWIPLNQNHQNLFQLFPTFHSVFFRYLYLTS